MERSLTAIDDTIWGVHSFNTRNFSFPHNWTKRKKKKRKKKRKKKKKRKSLSNIG